VEAVALELPLLEQLDLSGCGHLVALHLSCSRLETLLLQACGALGRAQLAAALPGCPALRLLDLQHTGWGSLEGLRGAAEAETKAEGGDGGRGAPSALPTLVALGAANLQKKEAALLPATRRGGRAGVGGSGGAGGVGASPGAGGSGGAGEARAGLQSVLLCAADCGVCSRRGATVF
jgi:hypothetical protein